MSGERRARFSQAESARSIAVIEEVKSCNLDKIFKVRAGLNYDAGSAVNMLNQTDLMVVNQLSIC